MTSRPPVRFYTAHRMRCPDPLCQKEQVGPLGRNGYRRSRSARFDVAAGFGFGKCECGQDFLAFFQSNLAVVIGLGPDQATELRVLAADGDATLPDILDRIGWLADTDDGDRTASRARQAVA